MEKCRFREMYDALPDRGVVVAPKTAFIGEIAELCMVSTRTVRCWLAGTQKPNKLCTSMIAEHLGVNEEGLFNTNKS